MDGADKTIVMLGFMWSMYRGTRTKFIVIDGASVAAIALLVINRDQGLIDDVRFMKSMIPHHSIAINNAQKAIEDHGRRGDVVLPARAAKITTDTKAKIDSAVQ